MNKRTMATVTIVGGFIVLGLKLLAFVISGSIALLSDALESIVNVIASFMMFLSVRISEKPADESHQYGHQKVEGISAFVEGALVIIAGLLIANAAIGRLLNPSFELLELNLAIGVSFVATLSNLGLSMMLHRTSRETGSMALEGDSKHLLSDVASSLAVNAGLLLASFMGWKVLDPIMALMVSVLVGKMGIELVRKSGNGLMDEVAEDEENKIKEILNQHRPQFVDYHDVRTRRSGNRVFAELHLSVDPKLSVKEAHDLADHLQDDIKKELPDVSLVIHVEPPKAKPHEQPA